MLEKASLDDPINKMTPEGIQRLQNPPQGPIDIEEAAIRHSISMYLAFEHSSQSAYE
jgi:hypothetical protein